MEIDNPGERLLIGQACTAVLFMRDRVRVPVVPNAAVLMEAGRPTCSSSLVANDSPAGSSSSASRDGDLVGVKSGVAPGERGSLAARMTCSWRQRPQGCPLKATSIEVR